MKGQSKSAIATSTLILIFVHLFGHGALGMQNATTRCISTKEAFNESIIFSGCNSSLNHPLTFWYPLDYDKIMNDLERLEGVLERNPFVVKFCEEVIRKYLCYYIYPPCDEGGTSPLGICEEDCEMFGVQDSQCTHEINFLLSLSFDELQYLRHCNNTLLHIEEYGINGITTSDSSQCIKIFAVPDPTDPTDPTPPELVSSISLPAIIASPMAIVILVSFGITLTAVHTLYRHKKSRQRKLLESRIQMIAMSNQYHFNGVLSQEYDVPLFQLTVEDVMKNVFLKEAMVPYDWFHMEEEIGHGAFGSVYKGEILPKSENGNKLRNMKVAIKTIKNSSASYGELKGFLEESMLMCEFDHPHVLGLIGISLDANNSPYLLLPFMENGDLREFLKNKRGTTMSNITTYPLGLNCEVLTRMCWEIAQGMEYLASKKLVHRDLAARNCMVDANMSIKVADFGLTRDIYQTDYYRQHHKTRVPIKWMAPESLYDRISSEKTDVWSYAVTCWEIFSLGRAPYPTISNADMLTYLEHGYRLQKPFLCPEQLHSLITSCWKVNPEERPTFSLICQSFPATVESSNASTCRTTIKEESLLDSIMSTISSCETYASESKADVAQDEYVDVDPQFAPPYDEIGGIIQKIVTKENNNAQCKYAKLPPQHYDSSDPRIRTNNGMTLNRNESTGQGEIVNDDYYVDMMKQGMNRYIDEQLVDRSCHENQMEHVRQSSTISDYVPMEAANNVCS